MSLERAYYENADRWNGQNRGQGEVERIELTMKELPAAARSLLDVGCGDGFFVNAILESKRRFDRLHALDRSEAAIRSVKCAATLGSIDAIPFGDGEFDVVTALQVIEHLPVPIYRKALKEVCRVARDFVLITVPYRQDLEQMLVRCPACAARFNPYYHLRSFDDEAIHSLLDEDGFRCIRSRYIGKTEVPIGVPAILRRLPRKPDSTSSYEWPLPCAVCGYELAPGVTKSASNKPSGERTLKSAIKRIWPTVEIPVRILGLYRRAD